MYASDTTYFPGVHTFLYASATITGVPLYVAASNKLAAIAYFLLVVISNTRCNKTTLVPDLVKIRKTGLKLLFISI